MVSHILVHSHLGTYRGPGCSAPQAAASPPRPRVQAAAGPPLDAPAQPTFPAPPRGKAAYAPDRLIVKFKPRAGAKAAARPTVVRLKAGADAAAAAAAYRQRPGGRCSEAIRWRLCGGAELSGRAAPPAGTRGSSAEGSQMPRPGPCTPGPHKPIPDTLGLRPAGPADVEYAVPDEILRPHLDPNDVKFPAAWGLKRVRAPFAWNSTTGSSAVTVR